MSNEAIKIGVIGGSGLYNMPQLTNIEERQIDTPFGAPSDALILGTLNDTRVVFVPRHGRGHVYSPTEVPYQANIYALKSLGVERIVAVCACGSLREDFAPGHIVIPDQLFDHTKDERNRTFFGNGLVAHISAADPFCTDLNQLAVESVREAGGTVHDGGTLITIEGPRFSTRAESSVYRAWGMSIIGMTSSPEAYLAREAGICYSTMAHITDYDVWHEGEETVTVDMVIKTLQANVKLAQNALLNLIDKLSTFPEACIHRDALADALLTDRRKIPEEVKERLKLITGAHLD